MTFHLTEAAADQTDRLHDEALEKPYKKLDWCEDCGACGYSMKRLDDIEFCDSCFQKRNRAAHQANYEILIAGEHPRNRLLDLVTKLKRQVGDSVFVYAEDAETMGLLLDRIEEIVTRNENK